jgi:hypothetical protein
MDNSFLAETLIGNDTRVVADGKKPRGRRRFMSEVQAAVLNCANEIILYSKRISLVFLYLFK